MKKVIVGLAAAGAVIALRPVLKRRMVQKMRDHCEQMMAQFQGRGEAMDRETMAHNMREHCEQMAAQHAAGGEPVGST
jgi:uncharacterized membrane protein YccC